MKRYIEKMLIFLNLFLIIILFTGCSKLDNKEEVKKELQEFMIGKSKFVEKKIQEDSIYYYYLAEDDTLFTIERYKEDMYTDGSFLFSYNNTRTNYINDYFLSNIEKNVKIIDNILSNHNQNIFYEIKHKDKNKEIEFIIEDTSQIIVVSEIVTNLLNSNILLVQDKYSYLFPQINITYNNKHCSFSFINKNKQQYELSKVKDRINLNLQK